MHHRFKIGTYQILTNFSLQFIPVKQLDFYDMFYDMYWRQKDFEWCEGIPWWSSLYSAQVSCLSTLKGKRKSGTSQNWKYGS